MADSIDNSGSGADFGDGGNSFGGDISAAGGPGGFGGIGGGNGIGGSGLSNGAGDTSGGSSGLSSNAFGNGAVDLSVSSPGVDVGVVQEAITNLANGIAAMATLNPLGAIGVINAVTHVGPQVELAVAATLSSDPNVAAQQLAAFAQY